MQGSNFSHLHLCCKYLPVCSSFSIASNLPRRGFKLVVYDADASKVQKAAKEWNNTAASDGSPSSFAACDLIVTMLPNGDVVRDVLLGANGIASSLQKQTLIIDTSSSSPLSTISLGKDLEALDLILLDSPITQTYMHATDAGECTLMVGCSSAAAYERALPVLQSMGRSIFHMGALGSGHAMKTLNNYIMASSLCALFDSLVAGQKFGLEPQRIVDVLNVGTGVNFCTLDTVRRDGLTREFASGFGLALLVKDLGITEEVMATVGFETGLPSMVRGCLREALEGIGQGADHTEALRGWENRAGLELRRTEQVERIPEEDFRHRLEGLNRDLPK